MSAKRQRWRRHYTMIVESAGEALEFTITCSGKECYQVVVKEGYLVGTSTFHWYGGLHLWLLTEKDSSLRFRSLRRAQRACRIFRDGWLGERRVPASIVEAVQHAKYQRALGSIAVA